MNQKVLTVLEYNKIIDMLVAKATSPLGREKAGKLKPMDDIKEIRAAQAETRDALSRLFMKDNISFAANKDLHRSIRSLEIGANLSSAELLNLASFIENVGRVISYGRPERDDSKPDTLNDYFEGLTPLGKEAAEIRRCIVSEDEIADDASASLKDIRRRIAVAGERIRTQLNSMVNGSLRTYLQDSVITQRDGRYCIPVKAEYKGQVPGMIHDQSSTGSTLFIEPQAIVNLNNDIKNLRLEEAKEIEVILANLSNLLREHTEILSTNQKLMTRLDVVFAKGRLALDMNASMPIFNNDRIINIRKARHPLLPKDKVVPIDIRLGEDFDLLVVTGPNTGGKTVSLKTVGLLTLMGQAGLHIPALDRSVLSVFAKVYADIGDEQSIEQSLSTFSSHMKNIVTILKNADSDSLCLFDELGAGTDPTEGAALAIAILDHLHSRGIRAMATTHYSELKVYALSTEHVENACCEFDVETLSPTYRLLIGIPGKSNAFAISKRLGLRDDIIEEARKHITEEKESFEDLISDLEQNRISLIKEKEQIEEYKAKIKTHQDALEKKRDKIEDSRDEIIRKAREEAADILREAKEVADETIRTFRKAGIDSDIRELEKARDKVRNKQNENSSSMSIKTDKKGGRVLKPSDIMLGMDVKIVSMGLSGIINSLPDDKGNVFVQCGIMKSKVNISDLVIINDAPVVPGKKGINKGINKSKSEASRIKTRKVTSVSPEINLLGKTVDEALFELDKYLDDAYLAHLPSVRIVHGKGTGALRNAVQSKLKKTKYIDSYRPGAFGEGDAGVTIATFKE